MKVLLAAVLFVLFVGSVVWLTRTRRLEPVPQFTPDNTALSKQTTRTIATSTAAPEENPEVPEETSDATTHSVSPGPVVPTPKLAVLAAVEEPWSGPEPSEAGSLSLPPATALENMRAVFRQYSLRFGGNPVGSNPEITAALSGQNARQVVFLNPADGARVNTRGELVDNWDSPYFFHQLSRTEMEIRSAGSDRKMWTSDDLVIK